ncbi:MAG: hypothetical protein KF744_10940 [Taibaiella sp.]|nr:hypothetical protein [Taibaiella sp.]
MNNFNIVHAAIRKRCDRVNEPNADCIDAILQELDATYHEHVDFYLSFLQDLGLIKYNHATREVSITERGKNTEQIFKE